MAAELQQALQSPLSTLLINFFVPWSLGLHFTSVIAITLKSCQTDKRWKKWVKLQLAEWMTGQQVTNGVNKICQLLKWSTQYLSARGTSTLYNGLAEY